MSHTLFPTDLPEHEWVEFPAVGFSQPATGVIYRDGSNERGVPLGGLGTGFITLCTEYYHNTMLWTLPMAVLGEDLRSYGADTGFAGRVIQAARAE